MKAFIYSLSLGLQLVNFETTQANCYLRIISPSKTTINSLSPSFPSNLALGIYDLFNFTSVLVPYLNLVTIIYGKVKHLKMFNH